MPENNKFTWEGDLNDDCSFKTEDGYFAHVECMGHRSCDGCNHENEGPGMDDACESCGATIVADWYFAVSDTNAHEDIFCSSEDSVTALTGDAARMLCEIIVTAHRAGWRR